jgi:3-oxoacyl-[acyl-carrier protein] reductase
MDLGVAGLAAFVAASSEGMGRAIAERFAIEGADVGMVARREPELTGAAEAVRAHGTNVVALTADVADAAQVRDVVDGVAAELGRLDCLVVNAGGPRPGTFAELTDDDWRAAHELTLMSAVRLIRAAVPHLDRSDHASITIVSSYSVRQPIRELVLSNSVRLSVIGLAKSLTFELAPRVRVNTLLPGTIATDRSVGLALRQAEAAGISIDEQLTRTLAQIPLGRIGTPEEFASVAVFLASPAAAYVTGQVFAVDGGLIRAPL